MTTMAITTTSSDPETNLLRAREWARDLAWLGGASALVVWTLLGASATFAICAALTSALLGAAIGAASPLLLSRRVRRVPVVLLLGAGAGLGANWGAASAAAASLATGELWWVHAAELGATAGLVVMGTFWLPAALLRARGRSTRAARIVATALSPAIAAYLALAW